MKTINQNLGWCRLPYELLADENLSVADAVVYSVLLDCCTDDFTCSQSISEIAELSSVPKRSICRCLTRLKECGYITRTGSAGERNSYTLADVIGLKRERKPKPRRAKPAPEQAAQGQQEIKLCYGEYQHVEMTMEQFDRLITDFGETKTLEYIKRCDEYCQRTGKHYSDYGLTIRDWISEDASKPRKGQPVHDIIRDQEMEEISKYLDLVD